LFGHETRAENQEPDLFNSRYDSAQGQTTQRHSIPVESSLSPDVPEAPSCLQAPTGVPKDVSAFLLSSQDTDNGPVNAAANDLSTIPKEHAKIETVSSHDALTPASAVWPQMSPKISGTVLPSIRRLWEMQEEGQETKPKFAPDTWDLQGYPSILSARLPLPQSEVHQYVLFDNPRPQPSHYSAKDQASPSCPETFSRPADGQDRYDKPGPGPAHHHDLPKAQPMEPQIEGDWPGIYMPRSLGAKDSGQLQDSGQLSRCMYCKQKLDRDPDAESALSLSCRKCGEHGMSSLCPCPTRFPNPSAKLTSNAPPTHHIPAILPT
jgi:hypothetical protein